jgi:uncharacterized DUF497 family protein
VVKTFGWDPGKNARLKKERGISFERVVARIARGEILDILDHPDRAKYPDQRISVVRLGDYAYLVPFVESDDQVFLKTVIPSRKATRDYLRGEKP